MSRDEQVLAIKSYLLNKNSRVSLSKIFNILTQVKNFQYHFEIHTVSQLLTR